jgi:hypothetical protein
MMKTLCLLLVLFLYSFAARAQTDSVGIANSSLSRTFFFNRAKAGFSTGQLLYKRTAQNFVNPGTEEFSVRINDSLVEGGRCRYKDHRMERRKDTQRLTVMLMTPVGRRNDKPDL